MAQVGGRGRQVQIVCVAIVLLVAASLFDAPPSSANEGSATPSDQSSADPELEPEEPDPVEHAESPEPGEERGGKVIYLTFDDGPSARHTRRVLELLDQYDAKATFFQVGEEAAAHPELTRAVVARGHALGNHTWSHKDLRKLSRRAVSHQITRTSAALRKITGRPVTCLRPPYGAKNARVKGVIRSKKLAMKLWDIDPRDWKKPGAGAIAGRVIARADPGDVTLMHDGGGNRSQSVRALKRILHALSKQGYSFETLPGC